MDDIFDLLLGDLLLDKQAEDPPTPVTTRSFVDPVATRKAIYGQTLQAAKSLPPLSNQKYTLSLHDVDYADPETQPRSAIKQAVLRGDTLSRRLKGTWRVTDNATGQVVGSKQSTIAHVPHYTDGGVFVLNGSKYSLASQMRLRPGVYTRRKENSELESHINILPGKGLSHRIQLDPESGVFNIEAAQSQIPLAPVLKAMGVTDRQLKEHWGDLYGPNIAKAGAQAVDKFLSKLTRGGELPAEASTRQAKLKELIEKMPVDPDVMRETTGVPHTHLSSDVYLAATKKLIGLNKGEIGPDDRDHPAFMNVYGPEDLLAERVQKDHALLRRALWKLTLKQGDPTSIPAGLFTKPLLAAIMSSGLGQPLQEINPLGTLEQQGRISRMGVGGLPSVDAIPAESRNVQPGHHGFLDPVATPESLHAGVDSRTANTARKGSDNRIYAPFHNVRTGQQELLDPTKLVQATIAFPGEMAPGKLFPKAMVNGRIRSVPRDQVDYVLPHFENAFGHMGNLVPMKSAIKAQRTAMGSRMVTQALPLVGGEAPLVQSGVPGSGSTRSFEEEYGKHAGAIRADVGGHVKSITNDAMTLETPDGHEVVHELAYHEPSNQKTGLNHTPTVRVGQLVQPGELLAKSNYTDDQGTTALGRNVRVAMLPGFGSHSNFEDAWVISESAAKNKFVSEHYYQHDIPKEDGVRFGRNTYISAFPGKYEKRRLSNFDDEGVIKPGTTVEHGDPLILAVRENTPNRAQIYKGHAPAYSDISETWDHHSPGVVTDVVQGKDGPRVVVRTEVPSTVGDKLSNRFGGKGVVGSVAQDDQMPLDENGEPAELLFNPAGIISRGNPASAFEFALGKIAAKTGKPYKIEDFDKIEDLQAFVADELKKHGVKDFVTVTDPNTGRKIPNVMTGNGFFMKLHHSAESKIHGRGTGGYTAEGTPSRGVGTASAKRLAMMSTNSLLSHGSTEVLRDGLNVRGQASPQFWMAFMSGHTPPSPEVPLVHRKFVNQLKAAGINVVREGTKFRVYAMTNPDVEQLTEGRALRNAETVNWKEGLKPVPGGLFDPALSGGHGGSRWSSLKLHEPFPNPVMEEPIRRIFGLTEAKYRDILAGKEEFRGERGPQAIAGALARLNLDQELAKARMDIDSGKKTYRDSAIRRLGYLKSAKENNVHPGEWVWNSVPVLPPIFRPVSVMKGDKRRMVADPNVLYKQLWDANNMLAHMKGRIDDVGNERLATYDAIKAVTGIDDPIHPKTREQGVRGILQEIAGSAPKHGIMQRKLLSSPVDLVGRSVIVPNPDLDIDSVGIPESHAWPVYKNFIVRRMVRGGMKMPQAISEVEKRTDRARAAMLAEMEERPVILDRAPVLHRYGIMAFRPKLVKGDAIQMTPLVCGGLNADFDGNCCAYTTEICFITNWAVLYAGCGDQSFLSHWQELHTSMFTHQDVTSVETNSQIVLPIGEFPRSGEPSKDRNGADVYSVPPGIAVMTYDHARGLVTSAAVTHFTVHTGQACSRVITARGRMVEVSNNESLCAYDNGDIVKIPPAEAVGRVVPFIREEPQRGNDHDMDFGWWYGALISDGWTNSQMVGYGKIEQAKRDAFVRIARKQIHENFTAHTYTETADREKNKLGDAAKVHLNGVELAKATLGCYAREPETNERRALVKCIPPKLLANGSRECLLGLLAGLIDGDGTLSWNYSLKKPRFVVRMSTSSPYLVKDIVRLCRRLGVRTSVTEIPPRGFSNTAYVVLPNISDFRRIAPELQFVGARERHFHQEFLEHDLFKDDRDIVPISVALAAELSTQMRGVGSQEATTFYTALRKAMKYGTLGRSTARRILALLTPMFEPPGLQAWRQLVANEAVHWDRYATVEPIEDQTVYDLAVPATNVFMIDNGLIIYDTMNYQVPAGDDAVKEAYAKLLPSRNLIAVSNFSVHQVPNREFATGLWFATRPGDKERHPQIFRSKADAIAAHHRGELDVDQPIEILKH